MGNLRWVGGVSVNYRSDVDCANDAVDSYAKVSARVGVSADNWEIIVYGRNITDEAALQQSFDTPVLAGTLTLSMHEGAYWVCEERLNSDNASCVIRRETEKARQAPGFS